MLPDASPRYLEFCYDRKRFVRPTGMLPMPFFWLAALLIACTLGLLFLSAIDAPRSPLPPIALCSTDLDCAERFPDDPLAGDPVPAERQEP